MPGIKGRSGRKPLLNELKVEEILQVSSEILLRWLTNPQVTDDRKIPVVSQLIAKRIPTKIEGEGLGLGDIKVIVVNPNGKNIQSNQERPSAEGSVVERQAGSLLGQQG